MFVRGEPSFHCPTLFSLCETLTPAWETAADNRIEEPAYEMKKKIKTREDTAGWGYLGRGGREKEKIFWCLLGGSRSLRPVQLTVTK